MDATKQCRLTSEVVFAIDEELAYIETLPAQGRADRSDYGLTGQLLVLEEYVRRARAAWVNNAGQVEALHELRKCAAIAIRGLLLYGCPRREPPKSIGERFVDIIGHGEQQSTTVAKEGEREPKS